MNHYSVMADPTTPQRPSLAVHHSLEQFALGNTGLTSASGVARVRSQFRATNNTGLTRWMTSCIDMQGDFLCSHGGQLADFQMNAKGHYATKPVEDSQKRRKLNATELTRVCQASFGGLKLHTVSSVRTPCCSGDDSAQCRPLIYRGKPLCRPLGS